MAAIKSLIAREAVHQLAKRKNWAAKNVGPMVVFCIVGVGTTISSLDVNSSHLLLTRMQ
jgi:hypothetical protein